MDELFNAPSANVLSTLGIDPEKLRRQQQMQGLLGAGLQLLAGSGYSPVRRTTGELLGQAGAAGLQAFQQAGESTIDQALRSMQIQQMAQRQKQQEAGRQAMKSLYERMSGLSPEGALAAEGGQVGPTVARAETIGQRQPVSAQDILAMATNPDISDEVRKNLINAAQLMTPKDETPASFKEFKLASVNPEYRSYLESSARNKGVNLTLKTGEGIASQVGPMLKESKIAAGGAVQQIDAADRIISAIDSGKIIAGPFADKRVKALQIASVLGITGKDQEETIANTRQAIRGLAEMTLQGRKQMRGEGQITENEGKLAEKAQSGALEDLTPQEIRIIANASRRASQFVVGQHSRMIDQLRQNPETQSLVPFYEVNAPVAMPSAQKVKRFNPRTGALE